MTVSVQCIHCHKRYNAPATMVGKRVKCKHCAKVFEIPADAPGGADASARQAGGKAPDSAAGATVGAGSRAGDRVQEAAGKSRAPAGKLGHPSAGFAGKVARSAGTQTLELSDQPAQFSMRRPSVPLDFPGAYELDRFAPLFLILVGLGWLALAALASNQTGLGWVSAVRMVAFYTLLLGVAFPLGYWAIRWAGRRRRFSLPPTPGLRALASLALAFALPIAFWQMGQSVGMLVFGGCLGAVVACCAVWFLFRIQGPEMSAALGGTAAALAVSVGIAYFALLGVDHAFRAAAMRSGTNQLTHSPMGAIAWDVPLGSAEEQKPHKHEVTMLPDVPGTRPSEETGATTRASGENVIVSVPPVEVPTTTTPRTPPATNPPGDGVTTPATKPVETASTKPMTTEAATSQGTTLQGTASQGTPRTTRVADVTEVTSPLVAKISVVGELEEASNVIFPAGSGNVAVAVTKGETDEHVVFFSGSPLAKKAEKTFEVESDVRQRFCLSANGETLARLVSFPKLGVQLWNTSTNRETKVAPLNPSHGKPDLLGFGANDTVVVAWNRESLPDVEVINARPALPLTVAFLRLKRFDASPCNPTLSPEGRQMAVAANIDQKGGLYLWDLMTTRDGALRTCMIPLTTWAPPGGIAYGPMSATVAVYFEVKDKGVIYQYRTADASLLHEFPYRTLPYPAGAAGEFNGRSLDYVDASTWLLMGRVLIDVETGKVLGDLGVETPVAQRVVDKETILLQVHDAAGKNRLVQVKLKNDALVARRSEVRGTRG
jgi:hypothetical protein